ncbi:hypothetical protein PanWU01x14_039940, partial [Parasponia andersonii]
FGQKLQGRIDGGHVLQQAANIETTGDQASSDQMQKMRTSLVTTNHFGLVTVI